jgi:hypothetical protein
MACPQDLETRQAVKAWLRDLYQVKFFSMPQSKKTKTESSKVWQDTFDCKGRKTEKSFGKDIDAGKPILV